MTEYLLLRHRNRGEENIADLDTYLSLGGFQAYEKVVTTMTPEEVIDMMVYVGAVEQVSLPE